MSVWRALFKTNVYVSDIRTAHFIHTNPQTCATGWFVDATPSLNEQSECVQSSTSHHNFFEEKLGGFWKSWIFHALISALITHGWWFRDLYCLFELIWISRFPRLLQHMASEFLGRRWKIWYWIMNKTSFQFPSERFPPNNRLLLCVTPRFSRSMPASRSARSVRITRRLGSFIWVLT